MRPRCRQLAARLRGGARALFIPGTLNNRLFTYDVGGLAHRERAALPVYV